MNDRTGVFVINLDRAKDRWTRISGELDSLSIKYTRVKAVEGATLALPCPDFNARGYVLRHGKRINPNEIGCFLSHLKAMEMFLETDLLHALVLEDDAHLEPNAMDIIEQCIARNDGYWDLLRISRVHKGVFLPIDTLPCGCGICISLTRQTGSASYLVNRKAAACMLRHMRPMTLPFDHTFDAEWNLHLNSACLHPAPINPLPVESNIGYGRNLKYKWYVRYPTVVPYRAFAESRRFVNRLGRWLGLRIRIALCGKPAASAQRA
ncbi:MAG TPA: glycosyltransferase family 25 protein [Opitutales bacterium]|nr:glycosyltransferase family 25 protein [Opitutales bacterium]